MDDSREAQILAVAALEEPTRRRLYDHVIRQASPVTRDDAAAALGLPRSTAAFHLDRLVEEGLLEVIFERRTGRTGPGAGRPAKLYQRSSRPVAVLLPERRYDLAGGLLAAAIEESEGSGESPRTALNRRARQVGTDLAATIRDASGGTAGRAEMTDLLEEQGFEPRTEGDTVVLVNCPFHALARQYTGLVCEMNLCLLEGLLAGLAIPHLKAHLEPRPDHCCVQLQTDADQ
ncbi:transcriptional regulator [Kribbella pittospori]|uniref:Transcriptional regulator n=1 Tax=Kribbella pittospori TaxID=722689 RepID=A0A4R0JFF4_9ACTN|nr:helix-turn-helix domain-containing protein [Kribbella pittospori]TCC44867.1 transcriptional regulator [Kribbella pittospori]